jgi:hypothetical protein
MTTTTTECGFTAAEFDRQCRRIKWYRSCYVPMESIAPFLDRCCEVGLLTRCVDDQGSARYMPTQHLVYLFSRRES